MNYSFRQSQIALFIIAALSQDVAVRAEPQNAASPILSGIATQDAMSPANGSDQIQKRKNGRPLNGSVPSAGEELKVGRTGKKLKASTQKNATTVTLQEQQASTMGKNEGANVNESKLRTRTAATTIKNERNGDNNQAGVNENGGVNEPNGDNNQSGSNN